MKLIKSYLLGFIILIGCKGNESGLNGKVTLLDNLPVPDTLCGEKIAFDSINTGMLCLCDSFVFFYSPRTPDYNYYCFDIKTGKYIAGYFPKGRGNNEYLNVTPIIQKFEENGEKKAVFTAINEEKAGIFNITQSVEKRETICDTVFNFRWRDKNTRAFISLFLLNDSTIIAYQQPNRLTLQEHRYTLPQFLTIDIRSGKIERSYKLYHEPVIYNPTAGRLNQDFYMSYNLIHPDKTKIAMLMTMLPQINILDLQTGEIKGTRLAGGMDFEDLKKKDSRYLRQCYTFSDADDKYIYALYADKELTAYRESDKGIIHVFDWEGRFIRKLYVPENLDQIQVDSRNSLLYGVNFSTEEVFCYSLPFI